MAKKTPKHVLLMAIILAVFSGCSSMPTVKSISGGDVVEKRRQRNAQAICDFESHRDQAAYEAALARWEQNDPKGCREDLDRLLLRSPKYVDAQLLLAEVNLLEKRSQDALKLVDGVLQIEPGNARALYTKGLVLDDIGQSSGALTYYEQAARAEPENKIYALCYQSAKDSDTSGDSSSGNIIPTAYTASSNTANSDTGGNDTNQKINQGPALNTPAAGKTKADKSSTAASMPENQVKTAKDSNSNDSYAHADSLVSAEEYLSEGQRLLSDDKVDAAQIAFHKAVACQPNNPQIPIVSAGAALRTNHPELAVALLAPSVKHFPKSAAIYRMLGVAYYRLGDLNSSQLALQQALSLDKSSALSYFLMGCTLTKLGQAESAEAHFQQARAIDPRFTTRR